MKHLTFSFAKDNEWWRYLILILVALFGGQIIGSIPLSIVIVVSLIKSGGNISSIKNISDFSAYGIDSNLGLLLMMFIFIVSLILLLVLIKPFHNRSYMTLFSGNSIIRWKRFFTSAFIWLILMAIFLIISLKMNPQDFKLNFHSESFFILILISIIFIPIQASSEEIFFRGYLSQGVAAWTKSRIMVIIITSILFGLLHSTNPEVKEFGFGIMMSQYIYFGIVFSVLTVLDDGIELAMGAHAANNVFLSIFVTSKSSVLQTSALFIQENINPVKELTSLVILSVIFIFIISMIYKFKFSILTKKIRE